MIRRLNNRGDTIVEVLIAIVVAATVLAGGFAASNSSFNSNQDALEHSQAINRAQGQAELLKANAQTITAGGSTSIFMGGSFVESTDTNFHNAVNTYFCVNDDLTASINSTCTANAGGVASFDTYINRYQTPAGSGNYVFVITEKWQGPKGTDTVTLLYKVDK